MAVSSVSRRSRRRQNIQTMKCSAWLGWQMESNWTDPFLFMTYSIAKPIAGSLILVVMYSIIAAIGGQADIGLFHYMYVSNAFFMYVAQVLFGVTWIIHDDREHFQTMKYIYISPSNYFAYMIGRSISKIIITSFAVVITMAFGVFLLNIPLDIFAVNWAFFMLVMVIGVLCVMAFGLALAGVSFLTARHQGGMNEGIAGVFYLFCGVVFPVSTLPTWGMSFARILPITYWLELIRRSLDLGVGLGGMGFASRFLPAGVRTLPEAPAGAGIGRTVDLSGLGFSGDRSPALCELWGQPRQG